MHGMLYTSPLEGFIFLYMLFCSVAVPLFFVGWFGHKLFHQDTHPCESQTQTMEVQDGK